MICMIMMCMVYHLMVCMLYSWYARYAWYAVIPDMNGMHDMQGICMTCMLYWRYVWYVWRVSFPWNVNTYHIATCDYKNNRCQIEFSIVGSLRDREVACSASDHQGSNFESCVWRTVSSHSSHNPQEFLLAQFSLYVHKGGLKPDSFHFIFVRLNCRLAFLFIWIQLKWRILIIIFIYRSKAGLNVCMV